MATLPARMASGSAVVIPSDGANIIQMAPGWPSVVLQASGGTPYPQYGAQQIHTSAPQQVPQKGPLETFLNAEPKVLGAVQILIGLIHFIYGVVWFSSISSPDSPSSVCAVGGYPFWGGIFFISSGSLCVAAANCPNHVLVKFSVGMNIISAIMSLIGSLLNLSDLIIYSRSCKSYSCIVASGLSGVLLLFSLLEFCITVSLAHFGSQAACLSDDQPTLLFMPYQLIRGRTVAAERNPPPAPLI